MPHGKRSNRYTDSHHQPFGAKAIPQVQVNPWLNLLDRSIF
jgi:hypothetical protein